MVGDPRQEFARELLVCFALGFAFRVVFSDVVRKIDNYRMVGELPSIRSASVARHQKVVFKPLALKWYV